MIREGTLQTSDGVTLPLEGTEVRAEVVGALAQVEVVQVFRNSLDRPIDATYLFPLPHEGAVYRMHFEIGERIVHAQVKTREEARQTFERARAQGRRAALLEEERPNLFTMSVASIRAGESIRVVLAYQHLVEFDDGIYRLVFPLVAADRFQKEPDEIPDAERIRARRAQAGQRPGNVRLEVQLNAPATSPTHLIEVRDGRIQLQAGDRFPNRDFVLEWPAASRDVATTIDFQGTTFLLSLLPPAEVAVELTRPRDLTVLLDRSCSMQGQSTEQARRVLDHVLNSLQERDRFDVVAFDHEVQAFGEGPATRERVQQARAFVRDLAPRGGTDLEQALRQLPPTAPGRTGQVLLLTDATVTNEEHLVRKLDTYLGSRRLYVLGLGAAVNRWLVERLARAGGGAADVLTPFADPQPALEKLARRLRLGGPLLEGLELEFQGVQPYDVELVGGDTLFGGQPIGLVGRFREAGRSHCVCTARRADGTPFRLEQTVEFPAAGPAGDGLERLWAQRKLRSSQDRQVIVELALRYQLLSPYTSFVGEDTEASAEAALPVEAVAAEVAGSPVARRSTRELVPRPAPVLGLLECRMASSPRRCESVVEMRCSESRRPESVVRFSAPPPVPPPALEADTYSALPALDGCLDLVFLIDETGSMGPYIQEVQRQLLEMIRTVRGLPLCRELRMGLVRYRDHPPQEASFVTMVTALSSDVDALCEAVASMHAEGGGDGPEAVTDGLVDVVGLNWRPGSVRTVVWIGDAPPHGVEREGDGFPEGCPCGRHWFTQAESCREMAIVVHAVGCGTTGATAEVFQRVAQATRGLYVQLHQAQLLLPLITGVAATELDKLRVQHAVEELQFLLRSELETMPEMADRIEYLTGLLRQQGLRPRGLQAPQGQVKLELRFRELAPADVEEALARLSA